MMHLCARAAAPAAIKNKHAFSFPSFPFSASSHQHPQTHASSLLRSPLPFGHTPARPSPSHSLPPFATRSFMSPLGGGGNVREAHFSPAGADRSTPPNEKGKGVIVKHVSLLCQNTTQAQWLHPPSFACDVSEGIHPLIYGSWDKHPWTVLVC